MVAHDGGRLAAKAKTSGRDYITPEDVQDVIGGARAERLELWGELLAIVGKQRGLGVEDTGLCCFLAHQFERSP